MEGRRLLRLLPQSGTDSSRAFLTLDLQTTLFYEAAMYEDKKMKNMRMTRTLSEEDKKTERKKYAGGTASMASFPVCTQ